MEGAAANHYSDNDRDGDEREMHLQFAQRFKNRS
jgi:hypothetical protein